MYTIVHHKKHLNLSHIIPITMHNSFMRPSTVEVTIPVLLWKEDDLFVVQTPALELSTFGETEEEAMREFDDAVRLFFEVCTERRTLNDALLKLGWEIKDTKWDPGCEPAPSGRAISVQVPAPYICAQQ